MWDALGLLDRLSPKFLSLLFSRGDSGNNVVEWIIFYSHRPNFGRIYRALILIEFYIEAVRCDSAEWEQDPYLPASPILRTSSEYPW